MMDMDMDMAGGAASTSFTAGETLAITAGMARCRAVDFARAGRAAATAIEAARLNTLAALPACVQADSGNPVCNIVGRL